MIVRRALRANYVHPQFPKPPARGELDIGVNFSGLAYRELRDGTGPSRVGFSAHWRSDNDNPALANF
jgi:hypothetical protein